MKNNKLSFFAAKTKSSLKHLGLVAVIISLSVMFSALCIMSLISLSDSLNYAMSGNPRGQFGGDVKAYISSSYIDQAKGTLEELKKEGTVKNYAYLSDVSQQYVLYSSNTYGKEYISLIGYSNASYPLANVMKFTSGSTNMKSVLDDSNGVVISEVLAKTYNIKIGDTITIASSDMFKQEKFKVVDMITSDYVGSIYSLFVNEDRLKSFETISEYILYVDGDQARISTALGNLGDPTLHVQTFDGYVKDQNDRNGTFLLFIRGLSVLGLFIGSFGIASAVRVIINKRKRELGILKSIGFVERDITIMLLMEVSAISLIGSLLGIGLGYGFFYYLVHILSSGPNLSIVLNTSFNWIAAGLAFAVSVVSSLLFAYISIKETSGIKPVYALKEIDYVKTKGEKGRNLLRYLFIALIFTGISIFLAQSWMYGVGAVVLVAVAIVLFSLLFRLIFFLILKIPVKTHNELELAWINLKLNYKKIIVSMVAIFIGMVAVNLIDTLVYSSEQVYSSKYTSIEMEINATTDRHNPSDNTIEDKLKSSDQVKSYEILYKAKGDNESIMGTDISKVSFYYNVLEGEQKGGSVLISEYGKEAAGYKLGDMYDVVANGKTVKLPISGFYETKYNSSISMLVFPSEGIFLTSQDFKQYFGNDYVEEIWISANKDGLKPLLNDVSSVPNVIVSSSTQLEDQINGAINILISFSTSVASLALLAGIILIITVTVLDVVSRRRDFAIYKVVGFKQNEVSGMVLMEYGIMTVITSTFSSVLVYLFTLFMNANGEQLFQINEKVTFDLKGSILWNVGLISLVLVLVFLVSRRTLKVKPSEVLRYE